MGRPLRALLSALGPARGPGVRRATTLAGVLVVAVLSSSLVPGAPAGAAGSGGTAASGSTRPGGGLTLLSQSPWIGPGQPMALHLGLDAQPRSVLTLTVTLYSHLTSRSAFAETVSGTPVGSPLLSAELPVSTLPADPQGGVDLILPVSSGDAPLVGAGTAGGTGPVTADLHCAAGACGGVYPLRLQLSSTSGGSRSQLFTYVVYVNPPADTEKLRLALVVPLGMPLSPADRSGRAVAPASAQVDELDTVAGALAAHALPVTLVPQPATLSALVAADRPRARAVASAVETLAAAPGHETLAQSYATVDATSLVSAGLAGELTDQVHRAAQVLAPVHPATGTWVAGGALDQAALAALKALGFDHLVVPASDVAPAPGSSLTPTRPFTLSTGKGSTATAVVSDPALGAHLAAGSGPGDALAAYQLLADLALVYYEQPNLDTPRAVVAVPPGGWAPDGRFLDTVLSALVADPVVSPVTLEQLFASVPLAAGPSRRPLQPSGIGGMPARQLRAARSRLSAFAGAVGGSGLATVHGLDDLLLVAEGTGLRAAQVQQALAGERAALDHQLGLLSIRTDTVRLTSTAAKVPVTLLKQASYPVSGTLEVVGDKVVFPPAGEQDPGIVCRDPVVQVSAERSRFRCAATIALPTNAVYVAMRARATGDFRLSVTLTSPTGGLVLASSHLTVRSMSTSLVAIALSVAALSVLLVWWARTLWRRQPRGVHARGGRARRS